MAKPVPLSELSDIELTGLLRAGFVPGESPMWTAGQLIEVEKRGTACLESDPKLQQAVDEYLLDWTERFRTAYQAAMPTLDTSKMFPRYDVAKMFPAVDTSKMFPRYDVAKSFPIYEAPKQSPETAVDVGVDDHFGEGIGNLPIESEIVRILAAHSVQMLAASDNNTNQILRKLKSANRRTFWVGAVGAGATVLSLIVAYLK